MKKMTNEEFIELCLERLSMGKTSDVVNFSYADTLAYIRRLKVENAELKEKAAHCSNTVEDMIKSCDACGLSECIGCGIHGRRKWGERNAKRKAYKIQKAR